MLGQLLSRHEHHMPEGTVMTGEPLDGILWTHIIIMAIAFGVVFPMGLVAGLARSRFHVPIQTFGSVLALTGYVLGHSHKGRQFSHNIHSSFASWVMFLLVAQVALGVILKLHVTKGFLGRVRAILVKVHLIVALLMPIVSWVQMGFGAITIPGFCHADHLGQCLAHGIMGSSFVLYGYILTIMLFFGDGFLRKRNRSQEYFDSWVITVWGIINTFTEHRWGREPWSHGDIQHTSMGIIWWAAGMLGVYLSWNRRTNRPQRNHIPAIVMIFTGYAMSQHSQHLEVSTQVHLMFGIALMIAGIVRIIEVSFVLHDQPSDHKNIKSWQYLTPMMLVMSGMFFMGATEEQMQFLYDAGIMHASYLLVLSSIACILYLLILFLANLYITLKSTADSSSSYQQAPGHNPGESSDGSIEMRPFMHDRDARQFDEDDLELEFEVHSDEEHNTPRLSSQHDQMPPMRQF